MVTKAVQLITNYGFNEPNFVGFHTCIFEYNIRSMRVLEKKGYKKDGVFEKSIIKNEKLKDDHRYSKINLFFVKWMYN